MSHRLMFSLRTAAHNSLKQYIPSCELWIYKNTPVLSIPSRILKLHLTQDFYINALFKKQNTL